MANEILGAMATEPSTVRMERSMPHGHVFAYTGKKDMATRRPGSVQMILTAVAMAPDHPNDEFTPRRMAMPQYADDLL